MMVSPPKVAITSNDNNVSCTTMARRLSRSEKGKWTELSKPQKKRPPIRIPVSNNDALIAENKLTLIGNVETRDVRDARSRVEQNGLLPLEMKAEIELSSGELTEVEFEYLKIEKHCFTCFSLFHEEENCLERSPNYPPARERKLGITQALALSRIEADKRRHDDRRGYVRPNERPDARIELNERRDPYSAHYTNQRELNDNGKRARPEESRRSGELTRRPEPYREHSREVSSYRPHHRDDYRSALSRQNETLSSHTPPPVPMRDVMIQTSANNEGANTLTSTERRSALAHIEALDLRDQLPPRTAVSGDSGRLQDVEIHYDDELPQDQPVQTMVTTAGGSAQSQSRTPASQRLGSLASLRSREKTKTVISSSSALPTEGETSKTKPTARRKTIKPTVKKNGGLSLLWKDTVQVDILEANPNFIDTKVVVDNGIVQVTFSSPQGSITGIKYDGIDNVLDDEVDERRRG
ncbi:hypothetical protein DY000_02034146 [Brassica cretica]|uniref:Zinc knuckle CX2CX4HX4C domain-containing protein n=1 Tax=Brassica cretica TaxID=69181 RepID=A0ABQ7DXD0_BRACR|nr:hypothetical protein DY000_02034146 [Brassica cretica]